MSLKRYLGNNLTFFFISIIPFLIIRLQYLDFAPIWDGAIYFNQLLNSIEYNQLNGFNIENFNVCNHISMFYFLYLSLGQILDFGNHILLNFQITLLSIVSLYYLYQIFNYFFKGHILQNILFIIMFSINPMFIATSININLDYPVLLFFICFFYGLIYQNKTVLLISSFFMMFTNFSGIYFLVVSIFFFGIIFFFAKDKLKSRIKNTILVLIIPLLSLSFFYIQKHFAKGNLISDRWIDTNRNDLISLFFEFSLVKARFVQIFILNFHWIISLVIISFMIYYLFFMKVENQKRTVLTEKNVYLFLMIFQFIFLLMIYFKYFTFTNPRYVLHSIFFTSFFFFYSIVRFLKNHRIIQITIFSFIILLFSIQNFFSLDPISKLIYETFQFGNKSLYKMVSITNEGMGIGGRDQLVYNTQYAIINKLINKLYFQLNEKDKDFMIIHNRDGNFYLFTKFSNYTKKRTYKNKNFTLPIVSSITDFNILISSGQIPDVSSFYYINLPWISNLKDDRKLMKFNIDTSNEMYVEKDGYKLTYYRIIME